MTAVGIDIGGTKIEAQLFDDNWDVMASQRVSTPTHYDALITAVADQIFWADDKAERTVAVGIGAAGLINPTTGRALAANLAATGHPFPKDIAAAANRTVTYLNDCRAMALSEAVFGAGKERSKVAAIILGTGVGGGICVDKMIVDGPTGTGGEFGHMSAPAHIVDQCNLPIFQCGCGQLGCIETYVSGPGLVRLAKHVTGEDLTPQDIAARRRADLGTVWAIWCALMGDLLLRLTLTLDPDVIVIAGGLSRIEGLIDDLRQQAKTMPFDRFDATPLELARGGDSSGARGAAYAAWQAQNNG